jgi:rod shape determining protein RodA
LIADPGLRPHIDWRLLAAVVGLALIGLATVYSVTWDVQLGQPGREFWTQLYSLPIALVAMIVCMSIDYRSLAQRSLLLYGGLILLLVAVAVFGVTRGGSRRWIILGGFTLQPSEFARLVVALVLASYFSEGRTARSMRDLVAGTLIFAVPAFLIFRQPDFGTALILVPVFLGITYLAGLRLKWIGVAAAVLVLASPLIYRYGLQPYQQVRIDTFFNPELDPRDTGYQQIQAKITVGSGGFYGRGFQQGTQGRNGFLPAAHNDFVFSVFAEEQGFLGVLAALGLYLFVITRSLQAARLARDQLGALLVVGLISGFGFQVLYNITMSAGLAPVKGLTLPLMSYGGSSLVATLAAFGLILNVRMRRFTN